MPKLKTLSAKEVQRIFTSFGFVVAKQKGSHIKFERTVIRQAVRFVPEQELRKHFYTE